MPFAQQPVTLRATYIYTMSSSFNQAEPTKELPDGWTMVGEDSHSEAREPQFKDCNISSAQQGTVTAEPNMAEGQDHYPRTMPLDPTEVEGETSDPAESTGGPNYTTHSPSISPSVDLEQCGLTPTRLQAYNMPVLVCDFQAWVSGDLRCWRPPILECGTTGHSSDSGSLDFILVPGQHPSASDCVRYTGTWADNAATYSDNLEV